MKYLMALVLFSTGTLHAQSASYLQAEIVQLRALVANLQSQVVAQKTQIATQTSQINAINLNPVMKLGSFVTVDPNPQNGVPGPNIVFSGANIRIWNGVRGDYTYAGTGNLIIGENIATPGWVQIGERIGSHNIIVGDNHKWSTKDSKQSYYNIIGGVSNVVDGFDNVVFGGSNRVNGNGNSLLGGAGDQLFNASYSVIMGGQNVFHQGDGSLFLQQP